MIPGKLFFESISITQQLSSKYQIHLVLNGIYYDRIKLFQTKYLCLTVNDQLEIQLHVDLRNNSGKHFSNDPSNASRKWDMEITANNNKENQYTNLQPVQKQKNYHYLKTFIPQAYKLMIQSKTIDVKFKFFQQLSSKLQQIKINFFFQTVTTFNRRKLGAFGSPVRRKDHQISGSAALDSIYLQNSGSGGKKNVIDPKIKTQESGNTYKFLNSVSKWRGTGNINKLNLDKQQPNSQYNRTSNGLNLKLNNVQDSYFQAQIQGEKVQFHHCQQSQISDTSQNIMSEYERKKNLTQKEPSQYTYTQRQAHNPSNNFDYFNNSQQNCMNFRNTSRTHNEFVRQHQLEEQNGEQSCDDNMRDVVLQDRKRYYPLEQSQKISKNLMNTQLPKHLQQKNINNVQEYNYHYNNEVQCQQDTLQSLAYQRQKILGQLFGKFNRSKINSK